MQTALRVLRYVLIALVVLLLGGVSGWYLYLRANQSSSASVDAARGLSSDTPTFRGSRGSSASAVGQFEGTVTASSDEGPQRIERLWRADRGPVAGFSFIATSSRATSSAPIYFAERKSGHIFSADAVTQKVIRITNTLMPKTYEAIFPQVGGRVILRSIDEEGGVVTFAASFMTPESTTTLPQALAGTYLPLDIRAITLETNGRSVFYLTNDPSTEGIVGSSGAWDAKPKNVFSSFLRSWRLLSARGQTILLSSPSDDIPGFAYSLGTNGSLSPLAGPLPGLTVLPHPTESALLLGASSGGRLSLSSQVGSKVPVAITLATVAEKCVWAPGRALIAYCAVPTEASFDSFLNEWYRGALHTKDAWWKVDAVAGTAELLYTPRHDLDVQRPAINSSGTYIAFINGDDQALWVLRIVE